jgi:hypothetical protein
MFSRALQQDIAYVMAPDDPITLEAWPSRLNDPTFPMRNGFEATFRWSSPLMRSRTVRSFFTCGPFAEGARLTWKRRVRFSHVLMNRDLGGLIDDIGNFCGE